MTGSGLYQMLQRRAHQAGYDPDVHPHQFRHTFAHDWLDGGGAEGDLMSDGQDGSVDARPVRQGGVLG
jgi:integrase/recombinase XerD